MRDQFRGRGVGNALLSSIAQIAVEQACFGIMFNVLEWNKPALKFFERAGASLRCERKTLCLTGCHCEKLQRRVPLPALTLQRKVPANEIFEEGGMSGIEKVATLTIAVRDQEEALRWFTEKLEFEKRMDFSAPGMRWLTIAPKKQREVEFVLASWFPMHIGKNAPCVVETSDCRRTYQTLKDRGVKFSQQPTDQPYGVEAVFEDLYGNNYALVERKAMS